MTSTARDTSIVPEIGKYHLVAELARGGMGNVYLAATMGPGGFNKILALKMLKQELTDDETYVAMFLEEARLAAKLAHPNIVQTNEVGSEGDRHFMVMELLDGRSLHRLLRKISDETQFTVGGRLRVIAEALSGLHYAHELCGYDGEALGVVHRDVSPLNVFVTFDGQAKVIDFGIAKAGDSSLKTEAGVLKGRVAYMAPEQAWGAKVDRRADVYSAGVMIWEAAAGRRLWSGMPDVEILARGMREGPPSLRSVRPDAAPELDVICARAMAKAPGDRHASAAELLADLEAHLSRRTDTMSMREIGSLASKVFGEERIKMNAVIEKALARMRQGPRSGVMPALEADGGGTTSDSRMLVDERPSVSVSSSRPRTTPPSFVMPALALPPSDVPAAVANTTRPDDPPVDLRTWVAANRTAILVFAGFAALVVGILGVIMRPSEDSAASVAAAAAAGVSTGTSAPVAQPAFEPIDLVVRVSPASALIAIDGVNVGSGPFHGRYPRDGEVHRVAASADGYDTKIEAVRFGSDVAIDVSLERRTQAYSAPPLPIAAARRPSPPPPPPPKAAPKHASSPASPQASASDAPAASSPPKSEINPAGGRAPLRPIVTNNPYGAQ